MGPPQPRAANSRQGATGGRAGEALASPPSPTPPGALLPSHWLSAAVAVGKEAVAARRLEGAPGVRRQLRVGQCAELGAP